MMAQPGFGITVLRLGWRAFRLSLMPRGCVSGFRVGLRFLVLLAPEP